MISVARLCSSLARNVVSSNNPNILRSPAPFMKPMRSCSTQPVFDIETTEEFSEKVINSPVPVLVDFFAMWCGPCKLLTPRLEEKIRGRGGEIALAKVDVDYAGELAMDYNISAVPTVICFKNGEQIFSFQGAVDDDDLDSYIEQAIQH